MRAFFNISIVYRINEELCVFGIYVDILIISFVLKQSGTMQLKKSEICRSVNSESFSALRRLCCWRHAEVNTTLISCRSMDPKLSFNTMCFRSAYRCSDCDVGYLLINADSSQIQPYFKMIIFSTADLGPVYLPNLFSLMLTSVCLFASCCAWLTADSQVGEFVFNLENYVYKDTRGTYRNTL